MTQQQAAPGAPTATPYDGRAEGHKAYGLALTLPQVGAPNSRLPPWMLCKGILFELTEG